MHLIEMLNDFETGDLEKIFQQASPELRCRLIDALLRVEAKHRLNQPAVIVLQAFSRGLEAARCRQMERQL